MFTAALWLTTFLDRDRRPRVPVPSTIGSTVATAQTGRVPRVRTGDHGANVAHFFSSYPWLAWPLVGLAVLLFLAMLPLRMLGLGKAPWYVRLGILATLGTGAVFWWRRRKRNQAQAMYGQQWNAGQAYGGPYPPGGAAPRYEVQDDPNWQGHG